MTTRRTFIQIVPFAGAALAASRAAAQATATPAKPAATATATATATTAAPAGVKMVDEKEPQAVALGYVVDATKADKAKYKQYAAGQHCGNCALYQAKETDPTGPCPLFPGKHVVNKAWCSAWAKKA